ncbi:MAG: ABC transporter ATP-binding protein [Spirochaetales bacterium]|nr:ABC transporter ATP-binding protein [Spirochaetales bacterium]
MGTLKKLQKYMEGRKILLPGAIILSAISTLTGMLPFIFIWLIVKELFASQNEFSLGLVNTYAWAALATAVGGVILYFVALSLSHLAAFRVEVTMRRKAMERVISMPLGFFDNNTSGKIRKIIDEDASITHTFLAHQLPDLAGTILMPLVSLTLILVVDWQLGLACLIPIVVSTALMGFMMGKKGQHFMKQYMTSLEEMNNEAVEYVRGIPVVKVFQQTVFSFKSFYNSIIRYKEMVSSYTHMWEKPMSAYTEIIHSFAYILIPFSILIIGKTGDYAGIITNLLLYLLVTPVFAQSIMKSMYLNQALGQASEAINRSENLTKDYKPLATSNKREISNHDITFEAVSFAYPGTDKKAVDNVSFSMKKGQKFALVGPSGSGKTTVARLLPRFREIDKGSIKIGGIDLNEIGQDELMKNISFVFQNTKLFRRSLLENIKYGNENASMQDIKKALELAQCNEFISRLPNGLETKIGVDGTYLSGGEQQRIALARAILKDAPIIVLDEATAFADPENEHLIHKALQKLTEGKTVLMIAHRLSSITDVDSIIVLNDGKIAEQGTHQQLLAQNGIYTKMWREYQKSIKWTISKESVC